jgi:prepilin-type N-terminal cleavage/methylation domain-containing protein
MLAPSSHRARHAGGFTLIELLIVIGIIVVLIAIGLAVGNAVHGGAKVGLTRQLLQSLDQSLTEYSAEKGGFPPAVVAHPVNANQLQPVADAVAGGQAIQSLGWYLVQLEDANSAKKVIESINPKLITVGTTPGSSNSSLDKGFRTVRDAWGNEIRYVHPKFQGVVFSGSPTSPMALSDLLGPAPAGKSYTVPSVLRSAANSDAGRCTGGRPYFYSAGPDGKPETTADNVYLTQPGFAKE